MTTADTRAKWLEEHRRLAEEAEAFRDGQSVAFRLLDAYDELTIGEKAEIHKILAEWLVSADNKLRYDAQFLTSQRQIGEMVPAVEEAIEAIDESFGPEAKYELKKLKRILDELEDLGSERR